jgi:hypothetical protein
MQYFAEVTGITEFADKLNKVEREQIPFTTVLALTRIAQRGEQAVEASLPSRFTVRRYDWLKGNVKARPATKQTYVSVVQDTYRAMELQESGGEKLPFKNKVAVPLRGARPNIGSLIRDADRPHAVLFGSVGGSALKRHRGGKLTKYTTGFIRGNILYRVIQNFQAPLRMKRMGKKRAKGPLLPGGSFTVPGPANLSRGKNEIVPMYALVPHANVPRRYGFYETVRSVVQSCWKAEFQDAFRQAMATARR